MSHLKKTGNAASVFFSERSRTCSPAFMRSSLGPVSNQRNCQVHARGRMIEAISQGLVFGEGMHPPFTVWREQSNAHSLLTTTKDG